MTKTWKERLVRLLRWSEKYTKTDMVYFFKGNFWLNVNRGISVLNGLVLSAAFARLLTKEAYGTYAFALAFLGVFSMAQTTGLGNGIIKGVARKEHSIIFQALKKVLPWSLAGALILAFAAGYYFYKENVVLGTIFIVGAATLPISIHLGISKSFLSVKGDFERLAKFNTLRTPAMTIILLAVAFATKSPLWIVISHIIGNLLLASLLYRQMRKAYSFEPTGPETEPFNSKFAFHSGIISIFTYLSEKLDQILLWKFLGAAPVAIYTYATTPVRELRGMIENQTVLALPKFAKKEFSEVKTGLSLRVRQMYFVAVPMALCYVAAAPYIFRTLFPQYADATALSQLAALSLLAAPRRLISTAILAHQFVRENYITAILPNAARIVFAIVLIPAFGIKGAVIAFLCAELVDFATLGILLKTSKKLS